MKTFSHICKWGSQCRSINDPDHTLYYLHESKIMCKWGDKCTYLATCDLDHCLCYSHKGLPDIRDKCSNPHCTDFVNIILLFINMISLSLLLINLLDLIFTYFMLYIYFLEF